MATLEMTYGKWHVRHSRSRANGLAGEKFTFANPTQYLAMADKLHDTGKAAEAAGSIASVETNEEKEVSAIGQTLGRNRGKAKPRALKPTTDNKCFVHVKYGDKAYKCLGPTTCIMKDKVRLRSNKKD